MTRSCASSQRSRYPHEPTTNSIGCPRCACCINTQLLTKAPTSATNDVILLVSSSSFDFVF
eukprot:1475916-Amphidinium_carterae.1